jgi:pyruvate formate lyase activating enzyme
MMAGHCVLVEDVMSIIREDANFYALSNGGITLSGGEPLVQDKFAIALLEQSKAEGFHTALDTSGHIDWDIFERALPFLDLVLYDLKHIDPVLHQQYVGASNRRILENLRQLSRSGIPLEIRMPIIPTINDAPDHIESAALFLASLNNLQGVRLLAYHRFAGSKYRSVGRVESDSESISTSYVVYIMYVYLSLSIYIITIIFISPGHRYVLMNKL